MKQEYNYTPLPEPFPITEQVWPEGTVPLVSICSITYNHESYIKECLEGFLMQKTTFPVEIIINDDASTDKTAAIIKEYEVKYPNLFKPIYQIENQYSKKQGSIFARFVYPKANGKYIAICEGDDYWIDPLKLQKQVDFLEANEDCAMVFTSAKKYYDYDNTFKKWHVDLKSRKYSADEIIGKLLIPTCTSVFRNSTVIQEVYRMKMLNKNYIFGDMILWLTLLDFGTVKCIPIETGVYRRNEKSVTGGRMSLDLQEKLLIHHEQIAIDFKGKYYDIEKKLLSRQYLVFSIKLLFNLDRRFANYFIKSLKKSFRLFPVNVIYVLKLPFLRLIK